MLKYLTAHPEKGLLGYETGPHGDRPVLAVLRAARGFAKDTDDPHLDAWRNYWKRVGKSARAGIWHETYLVRAGEYEAIYGNMPPHGLGKASPRWRRSSSLSRCPQGRLPALAAVVSTSSTSGAGVPGSSRAAPLIEPVEMARRVGSQPSLRWSRQARPAVVEPVPPRPGEPGLGPDHRSSSLSRCPQGRLPALVAVVSTGSTGGGPAAHEPVESPRRLRQRVSQSSRGLGPQDHRSSSLSR